MGTTETCDDSLFVKILTRTENKYGTEGKRSLSIWRSSLYCLIVNESRSKLTRNQVIKLLPLETCVEIIEESRTIYFFALSYTDLLQICLFLGIVKPLIG